MASRLVLGMEGTNYRLQLFWLHLRLLHWMLWLAAKGLVIVALILAGLVQSLSLISWWDWSIKVEHCLHGLEWCCVDIDATAVRSFGNRLEHRRL